MSDYSIFDISASGMALERLRMQIGAINMANVNTTRTNTGEVFKPLSVISSPKYDNNFDSMIEALQMGGNVPLGVEVISVEETNVNPRVVYEPTHPDADNKGFVRYPNINAVSEMVNLIQITRSYEANVRAFNATKTMLQSAMEIGSR